MDTENKKEKQTPASVEAYRAVHRLTRRAGAHDNPKDIVEAAAILTNMIPALLEVERQLGVK